MLPHASQSCLHLRQVSDDEPQWSQHSAEPGWTGDGGRGSAVVVIGKGT